MIYGLYPDGTYKKFKTDEKLNKELLNLEYVIFDNSTDLKGPCFTLVRADKVMRKYDFVNIIIEISFRPDDTPYDSKYTMKNQIPVDSYCRQYSVFPFIKQIFCIDDFREYFLLGYDNVYLEIAQIICINGETLTIDFENNGEDSLYSIFKKTGLVTSVHKELDESHIIFKNKRWKIVSESEIPKSFDYIFFNIPRTETLYLLSYEQYMKLSLLKSMVIYLRGLSVVQCWDGEYYDETEYDWEDGELNDVFNNTELNNVYNCIETFDIGSLLSTALCLPQFIMLDNIIYDEYYSVVIELHYNRIYTLSVTRDELTDIGFSLFHLLFKLLEQIELRNKRYLK